METILKESTNFRHQIKDIALEISWAKLAQRYFGKSASWIYHKFDGIDGNGKPNTFTDEELEQLKGGLYDLSERLRKTADNLK